MKLLFENWRKHILKENLEDPFWKSDPDAAALLQKGGTALENILIKANPEDLKSLKDYLYAPYGARVTEGDVVQGPWGDEPPQQAASKRMNAVVANKIEDFIGKELEELYGSPNAWTDGQTEAFDQINSLLDTLFPSGD